jgi:methionyl-tRNA formyltransferase
LSGLDAGITILFTVKALDAGAIILQQSVEVLAHETNIDLMKRLFALSGPLLIKALEKLQDPMFVGDEQDESKVTHCKKILKTDGEILWPQYTHSQVERRFRAYFGWPGVYTHLLDKRLTIMALDFSRGEKIAPGSVAFDGYHLLVGTSDYAIKISQLRPEGSKTQSARDFWNSQRIKLTEHGFTASSENPTSPV